MVLKDVEEAVKIVDGVDRDPHYSKIYYCSNEPLDDLFRFFSVKDKKVLSVMGSADQPFLSMYYGASSVDTFDINPLTKHYFYLRYWTLLYYGLLYPPKSIFKSHQFIYDLLQQVKCETQDERDSFDYWALFIRRAFPFDCGNLYNCSLNRISVDVDKLKKCIQGKEFQFHHFDLFEDVPIDQKFDIAITSNALEYAKMSPLKLKRACKNLKSLLNDGGMVISSHYIENEYSPFFSDEKDIFGEYFDYREFPKIYNSSREKYCSIGYTYTLRDVNKK